MNEVITAIIAIIAALVGSSILMFFKKEKASKKRQKTAKPPRVFADHARNVLRKDFEEDIKEINDAVSGDDAVNNLVQMGNARSRREH